MRERLRLIQPLASLGLLALSTLAFSRKSRTAILDRDGLACVECGDTERLEASHITHVRDEDYDNPSRGETLCVAHHFLFHWLARGRADEIGLSERDNYGAIKLLTNRLTPGDEEYIRRQVQPQQQRMF